MFCVLLCSLHCTLPVRVPQLIYPATYVTSAHGVAYPFGSAISPTTTAIPYFDYATAMANGAAQGTAGHGGAGPAGYSTVQIPAGLEAAYTYTSAPAAAGYLPTAAYPTDATYPAIAHQIMGPYATAAAAAHYQP